MFLEKLCKSQVMNFHSCVLPLRLKECLSYLGGFDLERVLEISKDKRVLILARNTLEDRDFELISQKTRKNWEYLDLRYNFLTDASIDKIKSLLSNFQNLYIDIRNNCGITCIFNHERLITDDSENKEIDDIKEKYEEYFKNESDSD